MTSEQQDPFLRRYVIAGVVVITLFFGVLGGWATFSQLASAAMAPGELGFSTDRKTIQHLEGGIVAEIRVKDGDIVNSGDILIRLDRTQPQAVYDQVKARYYAILATEVRLRAERDGEDSISFPVLLDDADFADQATDIKYSESRLFETRRQTLGHQQGIIRQGIKQLEEEIQGLKQEIGSQDQQIELLGEEIVGMQSLFEKKMVSKQRLLALQRETAELEGERSRNRAAIARARQSISEEELRLIELETDREGEILAQLRDIQGDILELNERLGAAQDVLARTDIIAPSHGTIVGITVSTVGGVIASRQALMNIVPLDETLLVRATLDPKDIDVVRAGQKAFVILTAFNQRNRLPLEGTVASVSADSLTDEQTGARYYLARVDLPPIGHTSYQGMEIYPGMQAEVMIQVGNRTPLDYLLQPIKDSMNRALRED
jgi:HlyD family type I secretion membrane fusion protein